MQNSSQIKSSTTAGLLGIFLGTFGVHDFYLGGEKHKKKAIIHVCLGASGVVVSIISSIILPNALSISALLRMAWLTSILGFISAGCVSASGIWGLIDGIRILTAGDAGLAAEGFAVANPQPMGQPYQQPMGQPYQQPMGQPYQQPMGQPYQQPMGQPYQQPMGQPYQQPMNQPYQQPMPQAPVQPQAPAQPTAPEMQANQNNQQ